MVQNKHIDPQDLMFEKHHHMTVRILIINISTLLLIGGSGYTLDILIHTKPVFLIIGILLAFVLGQILVIKSMKKLTTQ